MFIFMGIRGSGMNDLMQVDHPVCYSTVYNGDLNPLVGLVERIQRVEHG